MAITIRRCAVADMEGAPNIDALIEEYGAESSIAGLGPQSPQFDMYRKMEEVGLLRVLGAFDGAHPVGFIFLILAVIPHYGAFAASTESFFVTSSARKSGAGLRLLHEAEKWAKELGAVGLLASAPVGGRLSEVLPHVGYTQTNSVFFKALS